MHIGTNLAGFQVERRDGSRELVGGWVWEESTPPTRRGVSGGAYPAAEKKNFSLQMACFGEF